MTVIDVHTHMLDRARLKLLCDKGAPRYGALPADQGQAVREDNARRIFGL